MIRSVLILTFLFGMTALHSSAQTADQALTLADCIRLAEEAPSQVSVARRERDIASREIIQARAGFLPSTQIASGSIYNSTAAGAGSFISLNGPNEYITQVAVAQEFDTSGRLRADLRRAHATESAAAASLGIARRDLKRAVTTGYYHLLLTRRLAHVIEDAVAESRSFEQVE